MPTDALANATAEPWLEVSGSRYLSSWLADQNVSLAFTTYQSGKLFLLGRKPDGQLAVFERTFNRAMGLWGDGQTLWLSSLYQLWRFENVLQPGQLHNGCDRLYIPRVGFTTADLDVHDIVVEAGGQIGDSLFSPERPEGSFAQKGTVPFLPAGGRVVFVNTKFGCLATLSERHSFTPLWRPPFLSKLAPEDRCHLNGLALQDGRARYVTAVSASDVADAWRDQRQSGGVVLELPSGKVVASGLSMPHSPRVYRGRLWLLNSGTGFLGSVDTATGTFTPLTFSAGYLRGLAFAGNHAVVGLSRPRHEKTFSGLALDGELAKRKAEARCGLEIINLDTGDVDHWLRLEGMVNELYDVIVLPGVVRPMALGLKTDEIQRIITIDADGRL